MNANLPNPELSFERVCLSNGQRLHLVESRPSPGAGLLDEPTVVMVHGGAGNWRNWSRQISSLALRYRVLAPDLRGHGVSPWSGPCKMDDFCEDLRLFLDLKVRGPFVLLGHSFGGGLAARIAPQCDSRLRGLALLSTSGAIRRGFIYRFLQLFSSYTNHFTRRYPYAIACDREVAQHLLWHVLCEWDSWPYFKDIRVPTLAVAGELDLLFPPSDVRRMAELIPNCRYKMIPTCGHVPMWETPLTLQRHLDEWLEWVAL